MEVDQSLDWLHLACFNLPMSCYFGFFFSLFVPMQHYQGNKESGSSKTNNTSRTPIAQDTLPSLTQKGDNWIPSPNELITAKSLAFNSNRTIESEKFIKARQVLNTIKANNI